MRISLIFLLYIFVLLGSSMHGQSTVNSLLELQDYLGRDNVDVKMEPGIYRITVDDVTNAVFPKAILLNFSGNHSKFDFTGVTLEIETGVFQMFGNVEVVEIALTGSHLTLKGLTIIDMGETRPRRTALGVSLDGSDNLVEEFHLTVRGSYPYGYGDIFGKGGPYVIKHFKHSAILIRGDRNHLKNCVIIQRAYGHGIFCQGSIDAVIEGCYVEGEMRTSDDVLAEEGSSSPADKVDFKSVWGYRLQPGWTFSLQEDGIRAYNTGKSLSGEERKTKNLKVINCTVKNMRSGVTIGFCDGEKYVEGCSVIGNENGYWVGSNGQIIDSNGDAQYGPLYHDDYQNDSRNVIDLTVLDNGKAYGNRILAYIGGENHQITFRSDHSEVDTNMRVLVAGKREGLRFHEINPKYNDFSAMHIDLNNFTPYPVVLSPKSSFISGQSVGPVSDHGTKNDVKYFR